MSTPAHLTGYEEAYAADPGQAALRWFREAKFGLFIHYGLYSLLGRGEWVQYHERIPIAEYAKLKDRFTADKFDPDFITDLALEAGMKYVNLVCKHCDSFCLWDTKETDFNSVDSPAGRDLVAETAEMCRKKELGFFAFYEHGFDWRHPHGPAPWDWDRNTVRPHYDPPDPHYAPREEYDFGKYLAYVTGHVTELCSSYGPLAGVWLDGAAVPLSGDTSKFRLPELYALIRRLQPQALISYKWGVEEEGEDFLAPEEGQLRHIKSADADYADGGTDRRGRPMEVCTKFQDKQWGYYEGATHLSADGVREKIEHAASHDANLLLNVGPLGDGSIHPEDVAVLREVGKRLAREGWPETRPAS